MDTIVQVEGLRKIYGATVAVDDVSFEVREGEIFGMVGPNGAGKTTTIECLEGLRKPDRGTIRVLGVDPQRESHILRERTGMQLQQSNLPDRMKVWEALDLYASFYPKAADWKELLTQLGWRRSATPPSRNCPAGRSSACSLPWRSFRTRNWSSWTS
jgi:ABC-2 type transport system ATP-binding protein